jgi:hypothetical protein
MHSTDSETTSKEAAAMVANFLATAATTSGALPTQIPQMQLGNNMGMGGGMNHMQQQYSQMPMQVPQVPQSNQGALQQPAGLGMQQSLGMSQSIGMPQGLQSGPMSVPMPPSSGQGMTVSAPMPVQQGMTQSPANSNSHLAQVSQISATAPLHNGDGGPPMTAGPHSAALSNPMHDMPIKMKKPRAKKKKHETWDMLAIVGCRVEKQFEGLMYAGQVTAIPKSPAEKAAQGIIPGGPTDEDIFYHVIYEDGDEEDLEMHELQQIMIAPDARERRGRGNQVKRVKYDGFFD